MLFVLTSLLYLEKIPAGQDLLQRLNAIAYDLRMRATIKKPPDGFPTIFIIDIDEASLQREGRWPWSRRKLATLIKTLHNAGTAVIALDLTLTEAEKNPVDLVSQAITQSNPKLLRVLKTVREQLDADQQLARTLTHKNIILGYFFKQNANFSNGWIKPSNIQYDATIKQLSSINMQEYGANLALFSHAATQNGFFSVQPDDDGIVRKAALILEYQQQLYTSLAVEVAKIYLDANNEVITLKSKKIANVQAITHIVIAGNTIRTDANGRILIPYLGKAKTFAYISASDVLQHKKIPDLTDSIVIIGTSAQALADIKTTPLQASYPGVEIQATLIHALVNPDLIPYSPEWKDGAVLTLLFTLSLIMLLLFPLLRPLHLIIVSFSLSAVVISFNLWLWNNININLDIILPVLLIIMISAVFIMHRLIHEHRQRQRIHTMFGQYVPEEHIERLLADNKSANMEGERREMSVLFSDIRNFTAISEDLSTQQLKQFLNHYFTPITEIIFQRHGTIDKYIGDLVMAFWGAPLHDPYHAEHAVLAALAMRKKIAAMQDKFQTFGITQEVTAGIGIHTGIMNVGDMGSNYRRAYTVLGDAVNLGSRLESLTKQYNLLILASEETMRHCPSIRFRLIDYVRVKGRKKAVKIYEPLYNNPQLTPQQTRKIEEHTEAITAYLKGDWQVAYKLFTTLSARYNDPLHQIYLQRMQQMDLIAPNDWDGIFTHIRK